MRQVLVIGIGIFLCLLGQALKAQHLQFADSILQDAKLPALGYVVVSSEKILEMEQFGLNKVGNGRAVRLDDQFRIGSNTKAFTALLAAKLVFAGKISWETKFVDLFPSWLPKIQRAYRQLTLLDLMSFRNWLPQWSYMSPGPQDLDVEAEPITQRMAFMQWAFQLRPVHIHQHYNHSNLGYVAAGLMLERVAGQSLESQFEALGDEMGIQIGIGQPNAVDTSAIWGHNADLNPEDPANNHALNWLLAAGNIKLTLPDFARFIQLQLGGLRGDQKLLPQAYFEKMHFGLPDFAIGWYWARDARGHRYSYHLGNPGTFLCKVMVMPDQDRALIAWTNCMTEAAGQGLEALTKQLVADF